MIKIERYNSDSECQHFKLQESINKSTNNLIQYKSKCILTFILSAFNLTFSSFTDFKASLKDFTCQNKLWIEMDFLFLN